MFENQQQLVELTIKNNSFKKKLEKELKNIDTDEKNLSLLISSLVNCMLVEASKEDPNLDRFDRLHYRHNKIFDLKHQLEDLKHQTEIIEAKADLDEKIEVDLDINSDLLKDIIITSFKHLEDIIINYTIKNSKKLRPFDIKKNLNAYFYRAYYGIIKGLTNILNTFTLQKEKKLRKEFIEKYKITRFESFESIYNYVQFLLFKFYPKDNKEKLKTLLDSTKSYNAIVDFFWEIREQNYDTFIRKYALNIDPTVQIIMLKHREKK